MSGSGLRLPYGGQTGNSVVSAGVGAPAVSMIFAAAAQTGTSFAVSSAVIGGAAATITTGYQTHDPEAAFKAGLLAGSEGFKWGAISGAIVGGVSEGTGRENKKKAAQDKVKLWYNKDCTQDEADAICIGKYFVSLLKKNKSTWGENI